MFGILVVSHDDLAAQLVMATKNIVDNDKMKIQPVSIGWEQDLDVASGRIREALAEVSVDGRAIILTDMFGGTPTNVTLTFLEPDKVEILTGVNLPMLIKLSQMQGTGATIQDAVQTACQKGKDSILIASEKLHGSESN